MKNVATVKPFAVRAGFHANGSVIESFCDRKSFYRKARVVSMKPPRQANAKFGLVSYDTLVATVTEKRDGSAELRRTWGGWSATTGRHVAAFSEMFGFGRMGKADFDKLEAKAEPGYFCGYHW